VLTVVDLFVFRGCEVVAGAVEASVVVPVDPFQGGQFDVVEAAQGPRWWISSVLNRPQFRFRLGRWCVLKGAGKVLM
jgi:hypothetical protein